ncbi:MAG TPA: TetR/AcrR family transcriptional regulator [Bacillota bacterium]|nr:TetR/AcrR family transcriptional regulator [Bacillota bacterium]
MSSLTPRQIKAKQTKSKILESAFDLFSKKAFENITVDEIIKRSGTSKGAFYTHFKSKYEIFLEKFKEIDGFYEEFIHSLSEELSYSEKLLRLSEAQMIYIKNNWGKELFRNLYMNALSSNHNYFLDENRSLYKIINKFVIKGQEIGEFKKGLLADEITMLITRCMRGALYDWCICDDLDLVMETKKFIRTLIEGLKE